MATWNNSVPLGQAGTGAAFILPRSTAAQNFGSQLMYYDRQRQLEEQRRLQQAQQLAQSYRDNMLKASSGRLWANEIGKLEQDHIRKGMEYRAQGFDVYNPDPNDPNQMKAHDEYMTERARLEGLRNYRSGLESQYNELLKTLQKANLGDYEASDIQKLNDFVSGTSIMDLYNQNAQLPSINRRFDPSEYLPKQAATDTVQTTEGNQRRKTVSINDPRTRSSIIGSIANAPGGQEYLNRLTGGINPNSLLDLPNDREAIKQQVLRDYNGDPELRRALASAPTPVISGTPAFDEWVEQQTNNLYSAKQRFQPQFQQWYDQVVGQTKTEDITTPDFTEANYRERVMSRQLAQRREARLAAGETPQQVSEEPVDLMIPYGPYNPEGNQPQVQARNYIPMSIPNRNFVGSEAIDLYTGRPTQIGESSADYSIVGLTQVPVSKNPLTGGIPKGSLVQPGFASANPNSVEWKQVVHVTKGDGEDYFVDINRLPKNLTKDQKALVDRFKQAAGSSNTSGSQLSAEELIRKYSQ